MPMRRTIGISLAFLVISASAVAKMPDKNRSHHSAQPHAIKHAKAGVRGGKTRAISCHSAHGRTRWTAHHAGRVRHRYASLDSVDQSDGGPADTYLGPTHSIGASQIGTAAWYNFVGSRTSSGEVLDTVTATAAHRSLPLASYAKVTNLDSGRAVVVKINDRGPWSRRFIIDLSPRAAAEIGVRSAGQAPVIVEPVAFGPAVNNVALTTATFQSPAPPTAR
jgi:rare lipoprotein A (peptidoglycan hydrolase)